MFPSNSASPLSLAEHAWHFVEFADVAVIIDPILECEMPRHVLLPRCDSAVLMALSRGPHHLMDHYLTYNINKSLHPYNNTRFQVVLSGLRSRKWGRRLVLIFYAS